MRYNVAKRFVEEFIGHRLKAGARCFTKAKLRCKGNSFYLQTAICIL